MNSRSHDWNLLLAKVLGRLAFYAMQYWNLYVARDPHTVWVHKWYHDHGDQELRLHYPLTEDSIVFDLGGFEGNWTAEIYRRYRCRIFVFEPVPQFCERIRSRFEGVKGIRVFDFGLADRSRTDFLNLAAEGSSIYREGGPRIQINLVDVLQFLAEASINRIDLIKINIEGAEYDLLNRMLAGDVTKFCSDIQIQFHDFFPEANARRESIRNALRSTHYLTYDYPFVWENWRRLAR
jgi:FkbM family methyltransferase